MRIFILYHVIRRVTPTRCTKREFSWRKWEIDKQPVSATRHSWAKMDCSCWQKFDHLRIRDVESVWKKEQIQSISSEHLCGKGGHHQLGHWQCLRNFWCPKNVGCGEAQKRKAALHNCWSLTHFQTPAPDEAQKKPVHPLCPRLVPRALAPHQMSYLGVPRPLSWKTEIRSRMKPPESKGKWSATCCSKEIEIWFFMSWFGSESCSIRFMVAS